MRILKIKKTALALVLPFASSVVLAANCTTTFLAVGYPSQVQISGSNTTQMVPTVTAIPGGSGTIDVQYSTSPDCMTAPQSANWQEWPAGPVSTVTSDSLVGIVNCVQAQAGNVNGTLEVCE